MTANTIDFVKLNPAAFAPTRAHEYDAGLDLFSLEDVVLPSLFKVAIQYIKNIMWGGIPHGSDLNYVCATKVKTGIAIEIPQGEVGIISDRSSMGGKLVKTLGGIVDFGYSGEVLVCLMNLSFADIHIKAGDRVAQLVILPCRNYSLREVEKLEETERAAAGFGSSGR